MQDFCLIEGREWMNEELKELAFMGWPILLFSSLTAVNRLSAVDFVKTSNSGPKQWEAAELQATTGSGVNPWDRLGEVLGQTPWELLT